MYKQKIKSNRTVYFEGTSLIKNIFDLLGIV